MYKGAARCILGLISAKKRRNAPDDTDTYRKGAIIHILSNYFSSGVYLCLVVEVDHRMEPTAPLLAFALSL